MLYVGRKEFNNDQRVSEKQCQLQLVGTRVMLTSLSANSPTLVFVPNGPNGPGSELAPNPDRAPDRDPPSGNRRPDAAEASFASVNRTRKLAGRTILQTIAVWADLVGKPMQTDTLVRFSAPRISRNFELQGQMIPITSRRFRFLDSACDG